MDSVTRFGGNWEKPLVIIWGFIFWQKILLLGQFLSPKWPNSLPIWSHCLWSCLYSVIFRTCKTYLNLNTLSEFYSKNDSFHSCFVLELRNVGFINLKHLSNVKLCVSNKKMFPCERTPFKRSPEWGEFQIWLHNLGTKNGWMNERATTNPLWTFNLNLS